MSVSPYRLPPETVSPQPSGTVKALEWKKPKELRFRAACTHFGYEYFIDQTPNGWLLQTYLLGDEYWETLGTYPDLDDAKYAAQADYERRILSALIAGKPDWEAVTEADKSDDAVAELFLAAWAEADKAMRKFPQPNYVISKVAEEAGEVVKAAIHCAEGRETPENVVAEIKQAMAMLIRLYVEGDQVHGLPALKAQEGEG